VAARLIGSDEKYLGMATVISSGLALTASHLVENHQEYFLELNLSHKTRVSSVVFPQEIVEGLAALEFDDDVIQRLPSPLLSDIPPKLEASWESFYYSFYGLKPTRLAGVFGGLDLIARSPLLRLVLSIDVPPEGFSGANLPDVSGAPVIIADRIAGVIASDAYESNVLKAVQVTPYMELQINEARRSASVASQKDLQPEPFNASQFFERLSPSSFNALAHANGIRLQQRQGKLHMEHLIAGLFQKKDGPTRTEFQRAGIDGDKLAEIVRAEVGTPLLAEGDYEPRYITDEPPALSAHVQQAFVAAAALAETTEKVIRSRHLLRAALSVKCGLIGALVRQGVDPEKMLLDSPVSAAAPRRATQAGIKSDDPSGADLLDIKNEVEALCTVLASKDVKPPISLGLFGEWGSGKSFFMKKMEDRFRLLAEIGRKGDSAYCGNIVQLWFNAWHYMDTNLWASLANEIFDKLAQELARQDALTAGRDPDYERAQLVAQRADANEKLAQAEQQKREVDATIQATEQQLVSIQSGESRAGMSPRAALREGFRFAIQQPKVQDTVEQARKTLDRKVDEAAETLNIDRNAVTAKEKLLELQGIGGYLLTIWLAVRNTKNKAWWLLSIGLFLAVGAALLWLLPVVLAQAWIQSFWSRIASIGLAVLAAITPFIPTVHKALGTLHGAVKANKDSIEKARREAEETLQLEHQRLRTKAAAAQETLNQAAEKAKKLTQELDDLRSDRKMTNFIRQRQQSSEYAKYLGVIARARNDFEQLSTLLAKEQERSAREVKTRGKQAPGAVSTGDSMNELGTLLPRIDRIILYIDDLDRCPEDKVVDVLQAVHLLLAFPLFVVVVGVDPRWLLHSLRQHSKAFRDQTEDEDSSEEERAQWRSTPLNYLEKIFQIPFTLNPMGESGFGKMIDTLTEPPKTEPAKEGLGDSEDDEEESSSPESANTANEKDAGLMVIDSATSEEPKAAPVDLPDKSWPARLWQTMKRIVPSSWRKKPLDATLSEALPGENLFESSAPLNFDSLVIESSNGENPTATVQAAHPGERIEPRPEHLLINSWEQNFMKQLHEIIPSPRATKRFINIYRLIRASVDLDDELDLKDFIGEESGGQHRQVLMLLAILTGYPDQATEILRSLLEQPHPETWWQFIETFKGRALNAAMNDAANLETKTWQELLEKLAKVRSLFKEDQSCDDFIEWAPKVARYSFQSGRVLITSSVRDSTKSVAG
jgi:F0F1-type ATP synthase membrane subunit b/b'